MENITNYYNGFGIKPTNTHISAGTDFYIPNIQYDYEIDNAFNAFQKSYNKTADELQVLLLHIEEVLTDIHDKAILMNILHLYLALQSYDIEEYEIENGYTSGIDYFINNYLIFDKDCKPGICIRKDDTLFINSGIKLNLMNNTCGLYVNKSGMGNRGFDVRAQLVDEDYSGYVHLSLAYTKHTHKKQYVYCGDKVTQMMVFEIKHTEWVELDEENYNKNMEDSKRGDNGFGSSDVKH